MSRLWVAGRRPYQPHIIRGATTVLKTGGTPDWHGRPAVKRRPSDDALVMVYRSGTSHLSASSTLHCRFSDDEATSWTADNTKLGGGAVSGFPMSPPEGAINAGDGWLYVADNGDLLLHMWSVTPTGDDWPATLNGTWQSRSTDGAHSWDTPVQVDFGGGFDQDHVFATDDDFVLDGTIYAAARVYNADTPTDSFVIFIKSEDDGTSWEYVSDITSAGSDTQEIGLEYIGNNRIRGFIRSLTNDETLRCDSDDLGATWSLTDVTTSLGLSGRHRLYTIAHLRGEANWWDDPAMLMVGFVLNVPGSSQSRTNCVWYSPDRFDTVYGPFGLDSTFEDAGYGDLFAKADGSFGVVSYRGTLTAAALVQYDFELVGT